MNPEPPRTPGQPTFQLHIGLRDVEPLVWRRVLVPGSVRMARLAGMLIAAMGWNNTHLHGFRVGDQMYGADLDDWDGSVVDERSVTVLQALRDQGDFVFDYDFGDSWEHAVLIETLSWPLIGLKHAVVLAGENACPPDDVGGPPGYTEFVRAVTDPRHAQYEDYLAWVGGSFDPTEFDLATANARCQKVR